MGVERERGRERVKDKSRRTDSISTRWMVVRDFNTPLISYILKLSCGDAHEHRRPGKKGHHHGWVILGTFMFSSSIFYAQWFKKKHHPRSIIIIFCK